VDVRHAKRLWPTTRLWERWYLLPADTGRVALDEVVTAARQDTHLFIDLKGLSQRVSHAVLHVVGDRPRFTVASKRPRLLATFAGRPGVDRIRSAGNRLDLLALLRLPSRAPVDGHAVRSDLVDTGVARRLRRRADRLLVWGVDSLDDIARLERLGVTGVIVDDLGLIERWRDTATSRHP
jgi:hypothetical protein